MIYRRRVRKTGYSVRILTQHIKLEFGKRVLYVPFDLGLGKPFHSLLRVFDRRGTETVTHVRRRDRRTFVRDIQEVSWANGWNSATTWYIETSQEANKPN